MVNRYPQPAGSAGSLKWIQRAVNGQRDVVGGGIGEVLGSALRIDWRSPLASDDFAEYRDAGFLQLLGLDRLQADLAQFWPTRGPQWDALGRSDAGDVFLIEAKAHIGELCSSPSQAGPQSLRIIEAALAATADDLNARPRAPWHQVFYQLANRISHLWFLRSRGVNAHLVLVNFINDAEVGPTTAAEWKAAYQIVWHVLGLPMDHKLSRHIIDIYPDVRGLVV